MNDSIRPALAIALLPMSPKGSVVHKIAAAHYTPPAVDPKFQQDWDRAIKLEQDMPECLRGCHI